MQLLVKAASALAAVLIPVLASAQMTADPVSWSAAAGKRTGKSCEIRISASLKPGWHIYAINPGGDGTLIPTSFEFAPVAGGVKPGPVKALGKAKAMNFPGVDGTAYVYEGKTEFTTTVTGAPGQAVSMTIGYQSCNDQMCLPPKKKVLTIKLP